MSIENKSNTEELNPVPSEIQKAADEASLKLADGNSGFSNDVEYPIDRDDLDRDEAPGSDSSQPDSGESYGDS